MLRSLRQKSWYRWCIVAAGFSVMATCYAGINNCFSLFYIPVSADLGFSRQEISMCQTIVMVAVMATTPLAAGAARRLGLMRILRAGVALTVLFCALFARATALWHFYAIAACLGLLQGLALNMPVTLLVQSWFSTSLGLAVGITFMGSGVGGMVLNMVIARLVEYFGWQTGFGAVAASMLLTAGPMVFLLAAENPDAPVPVADDPEKHSGSGSVMRRGKVWLMLAVSMCSSACSYTILNLLSPHLQNEGYTPVRAAAVVSLSMGCLAAGKMSLGWLYDRTSVRMATLISAGFVLLGIAGNLVVQKPWAVVLILLGSFVGTPLGTVGSPLIVRGVFGEEDSDTVLGFYSAAANLGCALGPAVSGMVFDRAGSYHPMFVALAALMSAVCVGYFLLLPAGIRVQKEKK